MNLLKNIKSIFNSESIQNIWSEKDFFEFKNNLLQVITWTEKLSENFDYENGKYGLIFRQTNSIYKGLPLYKFGIQSNGIDRLNFDFDFGSDYSSWNSYDYSYESF